jgi:aminopeptidase N
MTRASILALGWLAVALPGLAAETPTQLPRHARPIHYDIAVVPDPAALSFRARAIVDVEVLEPTASLTLNALELTFGAARLTDVSGATRTARVTLDAPTQTATFHFDAPLARGKYALAMEYAGRIGTQAVGLYALDYDSPQGGRRALFTQFENSDARRFVPSWDEPAHKATFELQVELPAGQIAVSNMPIASSEELGGGRTRVRFERSPRMSTYLLYLAMGDLERATKRAGATEIGVVTKRGSLDQAAFALDSSVELLHEFNDYFGVPYPLPKLDNIAAPGRSQFFGAMENWGAISSFEYYLLLDPKISTEGDRQAVFSVAAHEISHQWFGDLVTMSWWDDLWLNESFASWMAARTTAKLRPEWNTALQSVEARDKAMQRDALATTHPIVQRIETVEQASQAFDAITYEKGEAVVRMLEAYVGAEAWRDGVRRYIAKHAYGNTVSDDLWSEVEAAAGQPVRAIAADFTLQPGIPLVRVESVTCAAGKSELRLVQGEFSNDRPDKTPLRWRVPVIASTLGGGEARGVLDGSATLTLPGCGPVLLNAGQTGYYRTLYPVAERARLASSFASMPAIDQLGLLADAWALGRAGLQPVSDVLELAKATPVEADPQVWGRIAGIFGQIDDDTRYEPAQRAAFRSFAVARLRPAFARVGWAPRAGEPAPVAILRSQLIGALGLLADPEVVAEARRRFAADASDPSAIPGPLRKAILGVVARHADAATWDALHASAKAERTPLVRENLYFLLAISVDPTLARRALDLALTDEPGATLSAQMISAVAGEHPDLAFDFALAHREAVDARVDPTSGSRYYARLAEGSSDPAMVTKLRAYATAHVEEKSRGETERAAASIADRIRVRARVVPDVSRWLSRIGFSAQGTSAAGSAAP